MVGAAVGGDIEGATVVGEGPAVVVMVDGVAMAIEEVGTAAGGTKACRFDNPNLLMGTLEKILKNN